MSYPQALINAVQPGVLLFSTREQAAAAYLKQTGKQLPAFDAERKTQLWMETRPAPAGERSEEAGYQYNFVGPDAAQGFYWMDAPEGVPYSLACVPNIAEAGLPGSGLNEEDDVTFPIRKLTSIPASGGLEVIVTSPFGGPGIADSTMLEDSGEYVFPPSVLAAIAAGTYTPPGV